MPHCVVMDKTKRKNDKVLQLRVPNGSHDD